MVGYAILFWVETALFFLGLVGIGTQCAFLVRSNLPIVRVVFHVLSLIAFLCLISIGAYLVYGATRPYGPGP